MLPPYFCLAHLLCMQCCCLLIRADLAYGLLLLAATYSGIANVSCARVLLITQQQQNHSYNTW
jgi:hypothetical protein